MSDEVIAIASDHGGFDFKELLKTDLEKMEAQLPFVIQNTNSIQQVISKDGLIAGAVESITGKKATAKEVTCIGGLGHETCGFDITLTEK